MILYILAAIGALCILSTIVLFCWAGASLGSDPYPPEASEPPDPVDEHFTTAPRETDEELDRLVAAFDWPRYSTWLKDPAPKDAP